MEIIRELINLINLITDESYWWHQVTNVEEEETSEDGPTCPDRLAWLLSRVDGSESPTDISHGLHYDDLLVWHLKHS